LWINENLNRKFSIIKVPQRKFVASRKRHVQKTALNSAKFIYFSPATAKKRGTS
jgi:hypothetical protein